MKSFRSWTEGEMLLSRSVRLKATTTVETAVMGAVGPEHCTMSPPNKAAVVAIVPALRIPTCRGREVLLCKVFKMECKT